ncbi:hypothetical protein [Planomicrobium okeanokoites]|uniref:hypothetical protein n=1 Tax=Planomicrobium okeanokoites TaxID=244 RepID=UPI002493826F|nr:hypothetical protein [Planomicrobium okeanokoites]
MNLAEIMYVLNSFALIWIGIIFFWFLTSLILRIKLGRVNYKVMILLSIAAFSIFAFNYNPTVYTDLYRHYEFIELMRIKGFSYYYNHELITKYLFQLVAETEYNQLLPFIVTLVRYSLFFLIFYKFIEKYGINNYYSKLYLFFFFAFFPLIESISGIRYYFSITVLGCFLIYDFYLSKNKMGAGGIFISLLIHTASSVYIFLRVLVIKKVYALIKPFRYLLLFWSLIYIQLSDFLLIFNTSFSNNAANSLIFYTEEDRAISLNLILSRLAMVITVFIMFLILKSQTLILEDKIRQYYNFIELLIIFTFGSIFLDVFFQRSIFFLALISFPLIFNFFESIYISQNVKKIFVIVILLLSVGMYANQVYGVIMGYF